MKVFTDLRVSKSEALISNLGFLLSKLYIFFLFGDELGFLSI